MPNFKVVFGSKCHEVRGAEHGNTMNSSSLDYENLAAQKKVNALQFLCKFKRIIFYIECESIMRKKQTDLFDYLNRAFMERSRWEIDYGNVNFTAFYDTKTLLDYSIIS